jgi:hypothetical protein
MSMEMYMSRISRDVKAKNCDYIENINEMHNHIFQVSVPLQANLVDDLINKHSKMHEFHLSASKNNSESGIDFSRPNSPSLQHKIKNEIAAEAHKLASDNYLKAWHLYSAKPMNQRDGSEYAHHAAVLGAHADSLSKNL